MIVSINQAAYLPWPGYFDRIAASDVHVVLDHVQFEKNSYVNRNKIRTPRGWTWLTVPVVTSGKLGVLPINKLAVADYRWPRRHLNSIRASYAQAPCFSAHWDFFEDFYGAASSERMFVPTAMSFILYALRCLDVGTELVMSSDLNPSASKSSLVLELCQKLGAREYLSGPLGRDYLDIGQFRAAGIEVRFHDYHPVAYRQRWEGFEPGLSVVDILMNIEPERARTLITEGRRIVDV